MILVVEDDADTAELLVTLLERSGWPAFAVSRGADALDVARTVKPTGLILDYMLPDMDGLEILDAVKSSVDLADIPVVMYSASDDDDARDRAEANGAAQWVRKGTGLGHLLTALATHC